MPQIITALKGPTEAPKEPEQLLAVYSFDLIEALDRAYPKRCIQPGESLEDAHRYAGKRELIDELLELKREQEALG